MSVLFVDGWFGPDDGDWQELWADRLCDAERLTQDDWVRPERQAWVARLDQAIAECPRPPVLIAHSLGCVTVAHWVADGAGRSIRAAMLVTPADVEYNSETEIQGFTPIPRLPFPFPTMVVASSNDRWMAPERARSFADSWCAQFADAGDVGHLTVNEGYGPWPLGEELLEEFLASTMSQTREAPLKCRNGANAADIV
ncbi:MAG: RBBP9/YdeN family alpha/beta hydrolase [Streptomyces sp.]|uniref:RBBP9/YdeN family alpha/beta hydrolase n=1 Tax=Streptomyces sp. TaxID=1931 RepID=UPI003D6AB34A